MFRMPSQSLRPFHESVERSKDALQRNSEKSPIWIFSLSLNCNPKLFSTGKQIESTKKLNQSEIAPCIQLILLKSIKKLKDWAILVGIRALLHWRIFSPTLLEGTEPSLNKVEASSSLQFIRWTLFAVVHPLQRIPLQSLPSVTVPIGCIDQTTESNWSDRRLLKSLGPFDGIRRIQRCSASPQRSRTSAGGKHTVSIRAILRPG